MRALPLLVLSMLLAACGGRTEVLVVTDSELAVPSELDQLHVVVTAPDGTTQESVASLGPGEPSLPRRLGLVHEGGPLGPFTVLVEGRLADAVVLSREARFEFQAGETRVLQMHLLRSCVGVTCPSGQTCGETACRTNDVGSGDLSPWTGTPPRLGVDAGSDAAVDACFPRAETCNGLDDDCDGDVDEDFALDSNPSNCGSCGFACNFRNGVGECNGGSCQINACNPGLDDCDGMAVTGCETDLMASANNCGACGNTCGGATRTCCGGSCARYCP